MYLGIFKFFLWKKYENYIFKIFLVEFYCQIFRKFLKIYFQNLFNSSQNNTLENQNFLPCIVYHES